MSGLIRSSRSLSTFLHVNTLVRHFHVLTLNICIVLFLSFVSIFVLSYRLCIIEFGTYGIFVYLTIQNPSRYILTPSLSRLIHSLFNDDLSLKQLFTRVFVYFTGNILGKNICHIFFGFHKNNFQESVDDHFVDIPITNIHMFCPSAC